MSMNQADTCYPLIDPVFFKKWHVSRERITLETILTPAPVEIIGNIEEQERIVADALARLNVLMAEWSIN